jgi:hypothetical protein
VFPSPIFIAGLSTRVGKQPNCDSTCFPGCDFFFAIRLYNRNNVSHLDMSIWNPVPLDMIGQNGTYWYVPVRTGTTQYKTVREFDRYIPIRTFNKTSSLLTHPERVRRDKIEVVQLLCMGYNVTKSNFKTAQD